MTEIMIDYQIRIDTHILDKLEYLLNKFTLAFSNTHISKLKLKPKKFLDTKVLKENRANGSKISYKK